MRLHKELDTEPQSARRQMVHLLTDPVPQIQPQFFPFTTSVLQAKIVHLDNPQLPTYLSEREVNVISVIRRYSAFIMETYTYLFKTH